MKAMSRKLSDEDRRAVDLLLDYGHGGITKMAAAVSQKRLSAAERVFKLIGQLPAEEPPLDLVARTMRRIDQASNRHHAPAHHRRPAAQAPPVA
jgi:hypothetical protein